jgi:hypothetical protein
MKTRSTIILLVIFVGGLLALWAADYARLPTSKDRLRWAGRVLPELIDVPPSEVTRVEVRGGKEPLVFERKGTNSWQMTAPIDALADRGRVDSLVTNLRNLARSPESIPISGSPAKFGLEPPVFTVRLYGKNAKEPLATLDVGDLVRDQRYVRGSSQGTIEVTDAKLLGDLGGAVAEWREKSLFNVFPYDVQGVTVRRDSKVLKAERSEKGWRLVEPFHAPADEGKIDGLLAEFTGLQVSEGVKGFVANDVRDFAPYGLSEPAETIELALRSNPGRPIALHVGKSVPDEPSKVFARLSDQDEVVKVDARVFQPGLVDPYPFRSNKVVELDPARAQFVKVSAGGIDYHLARGPTGWQVLAPIPGRADSRAVEELLARLESAQSISGRDPTGFEGAGLNTPTLAVSVWHGQAPGEGISGVETLPKRAPDVSVRFGRQDKRRNLVYVQTEGDPSVLTIADSIQSWLPKGKLAYQDRVMMNLPLNTLDRIEVEARGQKTVVEAAPGTNDPRTRWRMKEPVDAPADGASLARLEPLLSRLRAETMIAEKADDLSAYGLDHPDFKVTWKSHEAGLAGSKSLPAGATCSLILGAMVPDTRGSRYAKLADDLSTAIFTLSPEALAILGAELHSHALLTFPESQANKLDLRWPAKRVALVKEERPFVTLADWKPAPGSDPAPVDNQKINELIKALSSLNTPRFVQYSGTFPSEYGLGEPRFRVEVHLSGGQGTRVFRIGANAPDGTYYATVETGDSGAVALVPMAAWSHWVEPQQATSELPANVFTPAAQDEPKN